jgi:hypothetical protein
MGHLNTKRKCRLEAVQWSIVASAAVSCPAELVEACRRVHNFLFEINTIHSKQARGAQLAARSVSIIIELAPQAGQPLAYYHIKLPFIPDFRFQNLFLIPI